MTISLHTQTSAPNTAAATSVSPLEQSGSSKTKFSKTKTETETDIYQTVTDSIIAALEAD
ncbi:DNA primase, partial [Rahnella perminowiae]|nr:DNA primase [Rahnella perminowiae]